KSPAGRVIRPCPTRPCPDDDRFDRRRWTSRDADDVVAERCHLAAARAAGDDRRGGGGRGRRQPWQTRSLWPLPVTRSGTGVSAPVVVGVDGSERSLAAVDLAAAEAVRRGRPLRVVYAFIWPYVGVPFGPSPLGPPTGGLLHDTERTVREGVERARAAEPTV